jgi:hypothetical protein
MKLKLEIQPIPASSWGISLANKLDRQDWDKLRKKCYEEAGWACEICGETNLALHCHEVWEFDLKKKLQRLHHLECCCELCHEVHHYGRSRVVHGTEYAEKLKNHWCQTNKKTKREFNIYLMEIQELNRKRADKFWTVKVGRRILY